MADREMIYAMLIETSGAAVKGIKPAEVEAAADRFEREFDGVSNQMFTQMYDAWFSSLGEEAPRALPTPGQVWAIDRRTKRAAERTPAYSRERVRPRREFVDAMKAFRAAIPSVGRSLDSAGRDGPHEHVAPTWLDGELITHGREECPACAKSDKRRAIIEQRLAELPEPLPAAPWSCKCDGSGWRDEVPNWRDLEAEAPRLPGWLQSTRFDATERMLYPCATCRPDQFSRWLEGELV